VVHEGIKLVVNSRFFINKVNWLNCSIDGINVKVLENKVTDVLVCAVPGVPLIYLVAI